MITSGQCRKRRQVCLQDATQCRIGGCLCYLRPLDPTNAVSNAYSHVNAVINAADEAKMVKIDALFAAAYIDTNIPIWDLMTYIYLAWVGGEGDCMASP